MNNLQQICSLGADPKPRILVQEVMEVPLEEANKEWRKKERQAKQRCHFR